MASGNWSDESKNRIEKIKRLKKIGIVPYAPRFSKRDNINTLISRDDSAFREVEILLESPKTDDVITAGRVIGYRSFGKIAFAKIQDATGVIQVMFSAAHCFANINGEEFASRKEDENDMSAFKIVEKLVDMGDFVGVSGELFRTHKGELTIFAHSFTFLSKAIRPLPEKFHGITDQEAIYRQRYLDLITNEESYNRFVIRSQVVRAMREFYHQEGFLEIETPILGSYASGAAAKPFSTHHNDYDLDVFLRISPETSLKKATVGRFEKVFEIAKDFRNEGSDPSHAQEFTMVEHYAVYWNYEQNMEFAQKLIQKLITSVGLDLVRPIKDRNGEIRMVDFGGEWLKISYIDLILQDTGIDVSQYGKPTDADALRKLIKDKGFAFEKMDQMSLTTLVDNLYKKISRPKIVGPAILYNYPAFMQPLARKSDENPSIVEQFQIVVNGWEICKAYSELVDPIDQKDRFEDQAGALAAGDEEATPADYDFVLAMEYGMPPQSGFGLGIDRFLALILGQENLRDIILFPLMKPNQESL